MNQKTMWAWTVVGRGMHASGSVAAVDARDAVSRGLTTALPDGVLVGARFLVPASIIDAAPANGDLFYEHMRDDTFVVVRSAEYRADYSRSLLELRALWKLLGDVPIADDSDEFDDDAIEVPFLHFPAGTQREDIWHWFEAQNSKFVVGDALMGDWPE